MDRRMVRRVLRVDRQILSVDRRVPRVEDEWAGEYNRRSLRVNKIVLRVEK